MAWSLVQQSAAQAVSATTVSLPAASTVGNLLICTASSGSGTAIVPPSGWTAVVHIANGSNESYILAYFNNPGGITACAPTGGTGSFQLCIAEFTCNNVPRVSGASDTGTQTGGAVTNITITTGGTAKATDLAIVMGLQHMTSAAAITWTDPSGYTEFSSLSLASSTNHQYAARDLSVSAGGAQSVKITSSGTGASSSGWTGVVATFTEPAFALPQVRQRQAQGLAAVRGSRRVQLPPAVAAPPAAKLPPTAAAHRPWTGQPARRARQLPPAARTPLQPAHRVPAVLLRPVRRSQLPPPVAAPPVAKLPPAALPRKAVWFAVRPKRTQQFTPVVIPAKLPPAALPRKALWFGWLPRRARQLAPPVAAPPSFATAESISIVTDPREGRVLAAVDLTSSASLATDTHEGSKLVTEAATSLASVTDPREGKASVSS